MAPYSIVQQILHAGHPPSPTPTYQVTQRINTWNPLMLIAMDVTTVPMGTSTRDALRDYRDERNHPNYDAALQELLDDRRE